MIEMAIGRNVLFLENARLLGNTVWHFGEPMHVGLRILSEMKIKIFENVGLEIKKRGKK
jgi:hypothetical protein